MEYKNRHEVRCFVCQDGFIWSFDCNGKTNYPGRVKIEGDTVQVLGPVESDGGYFIEEEFVLHRSLTALSLAIEHRVAPSEDGSVTLEQAVSEEHQRVEEFRSDWIANHIENPDHYPLAFPESDAGLWVEQIHDFNVSQNPKKPDWDEWFNSPDKVSKDFNPRQ